MQKKDKELLLFLFLTANQPKNLGWEKAPPRTRKIAAELFARYGEDPPGNQYPWRETTIWFFQRASRELGEPDLGTLAELMRLTGAPISTTLTGTSVQAITGKLLVHLAKKLPRPSYPLRNFIHKIFRGSTSKTSGAEADFSLLGNLSVGHQEQNHKAEKPNLHDDDQYDSKDKKGYGLALPGDEEVKTHPPEPEKELEGEDEAPGRPAPSAKPASNDQKPFLNTWFTRAGDRDPLPPRRALSYRKDYDLMVEIGPKRRGLIREGEAFPGKALGSALQDKQGLPITVVVSSRDFYVLPGVKTLGLPSPARAARVDFGIRVRRPKPMASLQIDTFYRGHLLQSCRVDVQVGREEQDAKAQGKPAQHAFISFTVTESLEREGLAKLPERFLTIVVERDSENQDIDFRFIDRTGGHQPLACYDSNLTQSALGNLIKGARETLGLMVTGDPHAEGPAREGYEWVLNGTPERLDCWLPRLAHAGRTFYRALFPKDRQTLNQGRNDRPLEPRMRPGDVIQVNPVFGVVTLPWALLYERPVRYRPGKTLVCAHSRNHDEDCTGCPFRENARTVCPHGFWGIRYPVEQMPCWSGEGASAAQPLVQTIDNLNPLHVSFNVYRDFRLWRKHLQKIEGMGQVVIHTAEDLDAMETCWLDQGPNLSLIYFYTHAGLGPQMKQPILQMSDGTIDGNFLETCTSRWTQKPLVLLSGCGTGAYDHRSYMSLIADFRRLGARGVIGTECPIPELFAEAYADKLLPRLMRGEWVGEAMLRVNREFMKVHYNPMGLLYALYAPSGIRMGTPVVK